jgi:hypothetical protein
VSCQGCAGPIAGMLEIRVMSFKRLAERGANARLKIEKEFSEMVEVGANLECLREAQQRESQCRLSTHVDFLI